MPKRPLSPNVTSAVDPDLPINKVDGTVYHLACAAKDIADRFIFVGDPGRVPIVAARFDEGSITFDGTHREIRVMTGTFKGVRVTALSTGMGTDNVEIVMNEVHALKEFDCAKGQWRTDAPDVRIIRVGTCGSPCADLQTGTLAVTRHGIGMDNTCKYYAEPEAPATVAALRDIVNATQLGKVGVYTTCAHPDITATLEAACKQHAPAFPVAVGTTASGSGFYGCQGRCVGRFRGRLTVPDLVDQLGGVRLPLGDGSVEKVVNIEMENSAICYLSALLGYKSGTICAVIAKRAGETREFATPEQMKATIDAALTVALEAIIA